MNPIARFQIGKNGVSEGTLEALALVFKNRKVVRISTLKSSGRDRESIKIMAQELCEGLPRKLQGLYLAKIIGFTIIVKRLKNGKAEDTEKAGE